MFIVADKTLAEDTLHTIMVFMVTTKKLDINISNLFTFFVCA